MTPIYRSYNFSEHVENVNDFLGKNLEIVFEIEMINIYVTVSSMFIMFQPH